MHRRCWFASICAMSITLRSGSWVNAHTGYLTQKTFIDPQTTTGVSRYRVRSFYTTSGGSGTT